MHKIGIALLLLACTVSSMADQPPAVNGAAARSSDPYSMSPAQVAREFARIRRDQVEKVAREEAVTLPNEMDQFFACAEKNDWDGIKGAVRVLYTMAGAYEGTTNEVPGVARSTNGVLDLFWDYVIDTYGFAEQVHLWEPGLLSLYAKMMLKNLPPSAIIFGGTDPGRFVLTAYLDVQKEPSRFLITQNALSADRYMSYVRRMHAPLQIPSAEVCSNALVSLGEDVRSGRLPAAGVRFDEHGHVQLEGAGAVMTMNGILAKWIFDKNKDTHTFHLEESYVIPWMYPYLSPQGLIMKLNAEPLKDLFPEVVEEDHAFWDKVTTDLLARDGFKQCEAAQKAFSKMRSAIAGLYTYRRMFPEAEYAFKQAIALHPLSTEATYRLADLYMQQVRFSDAGKIVEDYLAVKKETSMDKENDEHVRTYLQQIKDLETTDNRRKELETGMSKGGDINLALELLGVYGKMNMTGQMDGLAQRIAKDPGVPPEAILQIARLYTNPWQRDRLAAMLKIYLTRKPNDVEQRIALAKCYVDLKQQANALAELQQALRDGGDQVRERIKNDSSFEPIRGMPELQEIGTTGVRPANDK